MSKVLVPAPDVHAVTNGANGHIHNGPTACDSCAAVLRAAGWEYVDVPAATDATSATAPAEPAKAKARRPFGKRA